MIHNKTLVVTRHSVDLICDLKCTNWCGYPNICHETGNLLSKGVNPTATTVVIIQNGEFRLSVNYTYQRILAHSFQIRPWAYWWTGALGNNSQNWQCSRGLRRDRCGRIHTLIARFMGPTWGPSGADRTQMGPILAPMNFVICILLNMVQWDHDIMQRTWQKHVPIMRTELVDYLTSHNILHIWFVLKVLHSLITHYITKATTEWSIFADDIFNLTFWINIPAFWLKFHRSLLTRSLLTASQLEFRQELGSKIGVKPLFETKLV